MHRAGVGVVLGLVLLLGLARLPSMAFAAESDEIALVIQYDDGQADTFCIAVEGSEISGADLLVRSDLDLIIDTASMGVTICQIGEVGCAFPSKACFCQCMGGEDCAYWNYFYRDPGEPDWTYSALGAAVRKARPGSVEAWVWGDGRTPPVEDLTFEAICQPPEPTPTLKPPTPTDPPATEPPSAPTGVPTLVSRDTPIPAPTHTPVPSPSAAVAPIVPTPTPTAAASQSLAGLWPFGLILAGLAVVSIFVWLRR